MYGAGPSPSENLQGYDRKNIKNGHDYGYHDRSNGQIIASENVGNYGNTHDYKVAPVYGLNHGPAALGTFFHLKYKTHCGRINNQHCDNGKCRKPGIKGIRKLLAVQIIEHESRKKHHEYHFVDPFCLPFIYNSFFSY